MSSRNWSNDAGKYGAIFHFNISKYVILVLQLGLLHTEFMCLSLLEIFYFMSGT